LTPTPGSGEQKMTKDETGSQNLTTQSETQQRKINRRFESEQTNQHDDSLEKIINSRTQAKDKKDSNLVVLRGS